MNVANRVIAWCAVVLLMAGSAGVARAQGEGRFKVGNKDEEKKLAAVPAQDPNRQGLARTTTAQQAALAELEQKKVALIKKFDSQREELSQRLKQLRNEQRKAMDELEAKRAELLGNEKTPAPATRHAVPTAGPDNRLDRILQQLNAMEQRLNRLEANKRPSTP